MSSDYISICIITWLGLGIICILVRENARLSAEHKKLLYMLCAVIGGASFFEWLGFHLVAQEEVSEYAIRIVYCIGNSLTPLAGGIIVTLLQLNIRWRKVLEIILLFNIAFQIAACFTGGMIMVNADHTITNGPLYLIYNFICLAVILLVILLLVIYGKAFRRHNRLSLYTIFFLLIMGFVVQEMNPEGPRVFFIDLTLCVAFLFIWLAEFTQLTTDEDLQEKQFRIERDELTGLLSRYAYAEALKEYDAENTLPEQLVVFAIDINGLKRTNDTLGHEAGDELIQESAKCIAKVLGVSGRCYRIGGDEFCVIAEGVGQQAEEQLFRLEKETASRSGKMFREMHLAAGYALAAEHRDISLEELIHFADLAMYQNKEEYYRKNGIERRR